MYLAPLAASCSLVVPTNHSHVHNNYCTSTETHDATYQRGFPFSLSREGGIAGVALQRYSNSRTLYRPWMPGCRMFQAFQLGVSHYFRGQLNSSYGFIWSPERICLAWVTFSTRLFIMLTHPNQPGSHDLCTSRLLSLSESPNKILPVDRRIAVVVAVASL